ncbi:uncharacterized protein RSE6_12200 [Rhynchosporium secalis]|uniref:Uncharacterized protein n=1 Tax=Rhynchosporium secalis TaxID=38038 RepID=A0A1E1MPX5_RHYSE|nr:uncharacterized protein RSE6_12200 [Rhynchosporium secalis]
MSFSDLPSDPAINSILPFSTSKSPRSTLPKNILSLVCFGSPSSNWLLPPPPSSFPWSNSPSPLNPLTSSLPHFLTPASPQPRAFHSSSSIYPSLFIPTPAYCFILIGKSKEVSI